MLAGSQQQHRITYPVRMEHHQQQIRAFDRKLTSVHSHRGCPLAGPEVVLLEHQSQLLHMLLHMNYKQMGTLKLDSNCRKERQLLKLVNSSFSMSPSQVFLREINTLPICLLYNL